MKTVGATVTVFVFPHLRFAILRDPAGWLSVNPVRGSVNTTAVLDRESPYVHNNQYTAVFMASDNGMQLRFAFFSFFTPSLASSCFSCLMILPAPLTHTAIPPEIPPLTWQQYENT